MRKLLIFTSLLGLLILAGCNTTTPTPEPTEALTETPEQTPTSTPQPTEMVDYCISCHTDKEQLISTAKPVVEAESESSGVG